MVLGSILSATDPVAVSALLNEVGAPPRLKTHIAGESLLNDGSAFVFFNIFFNMDLYRHTNGTHGEKFDWGSGIVYFLKLSVGSAALGTAIGLVLVGFVWDLKHRYNHEENVVQVMTTLAFAYFAFYLSESVLHLSGIVSVVFCGIVAKKFASTLINDQVGMQKFWDLLEHVLNTVLFTVGGLVWGTVVVGDRFAGLQGNSLGIDTGITGRDWGYLFLLYFFLILIRTFLVMGFYPIVSRIGLRSNFTEAIFMSWGGLRGAVGIALGIVIENGWGNVRPYELVGAMERLENSEEVKGDGIFWYRDLADSEGESNEFEILYHRYVANIWFFFAGGIAFLTLVINGTTAGPLLKKLGLAAPTKIREAIVKRYRRSISLHSIEHLVRLLADGQFSDVDFAIVRKQVSDLRDIQFNDLVNALRHHRAKQPLFLYCEPDISCLKPFFTADQFNELKDVAHVNAADRLPSLGRAALAASYTSGEADDEDVTEEEKVAMRKVFIALLRRAYETLINKGFIDARANARLVLQLTSSVERAGDKVSQGKPISDWEASRRLPKGVRRTMVALRSSLAFGNKEKQRSDLAEFMEVSAIVRHAVSFITAHKLAQETFKEEFAADRELSLVERLVLDESNAQISMAEDVLESNNPTDVVSIKTQFLCNIILNQTVHDVLGYLERGLLLKTEAEHIVRDLQNELAYIAHDKYGESSRDDKRSSFKDDEGGENL
uniref:Cation/H+ exchanger transmembrane domain-containing protein n=2 Tax=Pseudictyota dubia TaxID=2749911 RepID=A0A7R9VRG7_9STRA|mmetsp:Transcript_21689/g.40500  ORF Transcript_21689/g.40500 Transcript_21689/m.40500 type:complete len:719 (+) Transcript_21689:48-2204(+)